MLRTHTCGELRKEHEDKNAVLCGWAHSIRNFGGMVFIDLRDRYGITQIVAAQDQCNGITPETVLRIEGKVKRRKAGEENKERATGDVELEASSLTILSNAAKLPIVVAEESNMTEETRLKFRFLDLRRDVMRKNILMRNLINVAVREYLAKEGFLDIETPMLTKSTPEGARDYLVPSRVHKHHFFALPQSPQIFKQLFMISGFDKYYQIVRCFRDEDLRADRQPEFTQIDIEMSFVEEEDIYRLNEGMMKFLWKKVKQVEVITPFPRLTYKEAMSCYGSDKPDVRFGLELKDLSKACKGTEFKVVNSVIESGGVVKGIVVDKSFSRKEIDELTEVAKTYGAKGLLALSLGDELEGQAAKFFIDKSKEIISASGMKKGDSLLAVASDFNTACTAMGAIRLFLGKKYELIDTKKDAFLWITEFPLFEWSEEEKRHVAMHHPFTSPHPDDVSLLDRAPEKARSRGYDLTLNGVEIAGGSIRIHDNALQKKMFSLLQISDEEAQEKFGFLLEAMRFGAPPHGGIAYGFDRLVAIMAGHESIREVIAFPKNKHCQSLMDGAPGTVTKEQLDELHLALK
ncbi:MAG: aspartate--tRNA ligase [Nanoarchaeota archaeon]